MDIYDFNARAEGEMMFNHIVIFGFSELGRLVGVHEDAYDYYWRIRVMNGKRRDGNNEILISAVCRVLDLYGIPGYDHLDTVHSLNGCPPADRLTYTVASEAQNIAMYGRSDLDPPPGLVLNPPLSRAATPDVRGLLGSGRKP